MKKRSYDDLSALVLKLEAPSFIMLWSFFFVPATLLHRVTNGQVKRLFLFQDFTNSNDRTKLKKLFTEFVSRWSCEKKSPLYDKRWELDLRFFLAVLLYYIDYIRCMECRIRYSSMISSMVKGQQSWLFRTSENVIYLKRYWWTFRSETIHRPLTVEEINFSLRFRFPLLWPTPSSSFLLVFLFSSGDESGKPCTQCRAIARWNRYESTRKKRGV